MIATNAGCRQAVRVTFLSHSFFRYRASAKGTLRISSLIRMIKTISGGRCSTKAAMHPRGMETPHMVPVWCSGSA